MKSKARAAISIQAGSPSMVAGIGQRRDHQAVPVGQHLVVEAGPDPFAAQHQEACRAAWRAAPRPPSLRGNVLEAIEDIVTFEIALVGHVVMLQQKTQHFRRPAPRRSRPATRRRTCPPRPPNRRRARRENAPSGGRHLARRASRPSRPRAGGTAGCRCAHRPAPAARAAGRCRRASSRNAAPASARRPSSARSRRRDDRRCRPRRCARACARSARRSARRRWPQPRPPEQFEHRGLRKFRRAAQAAVGRIERAADLPGAAGRARRAPIMTLPAGRACSASRAISASRFCPILSGSSRNSRETSRSTSTKAGRP